MPWNLAYIGFRGLRVYWNCPFSCTIQTENIAVIFYHLSSIFGIPYWKQLCQIWAHLEALRQPRGVWVLARYFSYSRQKNDQKSLQYCTKHIFGFLIPTHMCINTKIATSRSWTQVMARPIRDFTLLDDGHFKNGLKQVVHPNIFLWHPLLLLKSKKQRWSNIVYMLYKCFVFTGTASGPWTTTPPVNGHMWSCVISPRGTKWYIHHYSCLTF